MNDYDFVIILGDDGPAPAPQPESPAAELPDVPHEVARRMVKHPDKRASWTQQRQHMMDNAHEVWAGGGFTYYVLKKYQAPKTERANPYARWFCLTTSPASRDGDLGDTYVSDVKRYARRIK